MKTTIEHLLTTRFEVIADYPSSSYFIGEIIEMNADFFKNYPHLFRPLKWWENRTEDEMPKYLKIGEKIELDPVKFEYYRIHKWHMNRFFGQVDIDRMSGCSLCTFNPDYTYRPCSEEEYLANQNP